MSQLQEEKQHHEEEVEGLHLDIRSLKQLSQQQAALIQDLQRHQGQEGLQHHVVRLKEENWVRGGGWIIGWGWIPPILSCGNLQHPTWEQCMGPLASPDPVSGFWGGVSLTRAVFAQELSQKLEKQERTTLKLQKQLRAYTKQIQEFTGKYTHGKGDTGMGVSSLLWCWCVAHRDLLQVPWPRV